MNRLLWVISLVFLLFPAAFAANLVGVTPDEMDALLAKGAKVIDIRTPEEWKSTGIIPGSEKLTYFDATGQYNQPQWLQTLTAKVKSPHAPVVLICRSGHRSATVGRMLTQEAGFQQVYHLEKGIRGWTAEGRKLSPLPGE